MKIIFNRDADVTIINHPFGLDSLYYQKGEETDIETYSEYEYGLDMWAIKLNDKTEFFVMKEDVEIIT